MAGKKHRLYWQTCLDSNLQSNCKTTETWQKCPCEDNVSNSNNLAVFISRQSKATTRHTIINSLSEPNSIPANTLHHHIKYCLLFVFSWTGSGGLQKRRADDGLWTCTDTFSRWKVPSWPPKCRRNLASHFGVRCCGISWIWRSSLVVNQFVMSDKDTVLVTAAEIPNAFDTAIILTWWKKNYLIPLNTLLCLVL